MTSFAPIGLPRGPISGLKEAIGLAVGSGFNEAARERYSGDLNADNQNHPSGMNLRLWH